MLYVNNVVFIKLYRIPMDPPVKTPDGMRAANGKHSRRRTEQVEWMP
ncbi:MAG: hypothetical protein ABJD53_17045 [Gammaproteobacteria bacterium]